MGVTITEKLYQAVDIADIGVFRRLSDWTNAVGS